MYRVKAILHTGTKGEKGTPRTDGRYPLRIGRLCNVFWKEQIPMKIEWITDENGGDYSGFSIWSSNVISGKTEGDLLYVTTMNSVYVFEQVGYKE